MIDLIHDIFNIADRYGLKIVNIDTTDVTLMARIEIFPTIYMQIYRNLKKDKLNMALILGNDRVYGVDGEGGLYHEHPAEDSTFHVPKNFELWHYRWGENPIAERISQYIENLPNHTKINENNVDKVAELLKTNRDNLHISCEEIP